MKYFGTDGVRGIANQDLSPELSFKLGRIGGYILTKHTDKKNPQVLVGRDTRISGQLLQDALISGLLSVGIEVLNLGVITTPGVSYLVRAQEADAGVMITASHNPVEYNGIKFFGSDGFKLSDDLELEIEHLLDKEDNLPRPSADGLGTVSEYNEGVNKYIKFLEDTVDEDLSGMKVVIDAANGSTSRLVSRLFADVNLDFDTMATVPDGLNINDHVGSTHPENLQKRVVEENADLGLAFDGDGDRCIAVDENGNVIDGDKIMYICAKHWHNEERLKDNTVVTTVMSNLGFTKSLANQNIKNVQTKVGDRYVVEEMLKHGYNIGGEQSGHIIFLDFNNTGDGLLTALQLLSVIKKSGQSLFEMANEVEYYPQKLVNLQVPNKNSILNDQNIQKQINKVRAELGDEGRVVVRPSGTEPLLRVMVEASTSELVDKYINEIVAIIKQ
ncbi:MAG: phosphoglucosamine mutase [Firmicutes bacterium]|uniref:Phosphoglucosamine mutase n=1 Tax=Candidatus Gallilactobacillus intestinavium TaxID=2840838 RepID=A0A9D9E431_9LACO|nr:phosphoglucosamine mutase [Candidatus Gallilactobacillus intestinavium]